jgi:lysophospholipase L1-like esterase
MLRLSWACLVTSAFLSNSSGPVSDGRVVTEKLVLVAFGDSLTAGYRSPTWEEEQPRPTPYTGFLKKRTDEMLEKRGVVGLMVEFLNRGVVGELTEDMVERFDRDVVEPRPDSVIILGGSNDLGWGLEPPLVAGNLAKMTGEALTEGIRPVTCTVPSVLGFDEGIQPRMQLNRLIKRYSIDHGVVCVDLFSATGDSAGRLRKDYSNDGLHLSVAGYEAMAKAIFSDAVRGIVSKRM